MDSVRESLESQVRECFGRVVYSHKTHERMADHYDWWNGFVVYGLIILSALTASGAVSIVFSDEFLFKAATAIVSLITLFFNGLAKNFDFAVLAQRHRETAANLWNVRENYLSLLTDLKDEGFSIDQAKERRDDLQSELHGIYSGAPHTNSKAYKEAQDRLQNKEDLTFSDEEIDAFLPADLKRTGS